MVDEWTELAFVSIQKYGAADEYQFGVLTDTIDLGIGTKAIESTALVNGGRVVKYTPEEDTTLTLEIFPVGAKANQTTPTGLANWFYGDEAGTTHSSATGTYYINTHSRYKFRVVVLWTDQTADAITNGAGGAISSGDALRYSFWNCYLISSKLAYTDDILTGSVEFTCPPFTKAAAGTIAIEEADSETLPEMQDFGATYPTPAWA